MKKILLFLVIAAGSIGLSAQVAGDLDVTFGKEGIAMFDGHQAGSALGQVIELLPDGSILAGGTTEGQLSTGVAITRFLPDGRVDDAWAEEGKLIFLDPAGFRDMTVLNDGRILIIGLEDIAIHRFLPDGTPDYSFGTGGKIEIWDERLYNISPMHIEVLADGKMLIGGEQSTQGSNLMFLQLMPDGALDTSFGNKGLVMIDLAYYDDISTFLVQPDGKIVAAGGGGNSTAYDLWLLRLLPDGTRDSTFGIAGCAIYSFDQNDIEYITALALQPDGKLVAGGITGYHPLLTRFEPDGLLDSTFGVNGLSQILAQFPDDYLQALALRPDGRIVVLSHYDQAGEGWAVAQALPDGTLDTTFANGGYLFTFSFADNVYPVDIALTESGDILALVDLEFINWNTYESKVTYLLEKYKATGVVDNTFESPGIDYQLTFDISDELFDKFVVQPDGKIIGKRYGGVGEQLVRILPDGALDPSFGEGGWLSLYFSGLQDIRYTALALQPGGKIIVAGYGTDNSSGDYRLLVARLLPNGQPDVSFNWDGFYIGGAENEIGLTAIVQPDGNILVGGYVYGGWTGTSQMLLLRLKSNGTLDLSFGNNGKVFLMINSRRPYPYDIDLMPDGRIVLAGHITNSEYKNIPFIARFQPNGAPDNTFGDMGGSLLTTFEGSVEATALDLVIRPDGAILIAGNADGYVETDSSFLWFDGFFMAQYDVNGKPDTAFGRQGVMLQSKETGEMIVSGITLQPDGKIIAAGTVSPYVVGATEKWTLWRFMPDGEPDASWGDAGELSMEIGDWHSAATGVFWLPEGKILAGGFASNGRDLDLTFARYFPGKVVISTVDLTGQAPALRVQSPVTGRAYVWYTLKAPSTIRLHLLDAQGKVIFSMADDELQAPGEYQQEIPLSGLPAGWYGVVLETRLGNASQVLIKP